MLSRAYYLNCDVCDTRLVRSAAIEHYDGPCGQGNSIQYLLKMAHLHEIKADDMGRAISVQSSELVYDRTAPLTEGVCFYCPTPEDHLNEMCRKVTREEYLNKVIEKFEMPYWSNFQNHFDYLRKAQVAMMEQKHRNEMEELYKKRQETHEARQFETAARETENEAVYQMRFERSEAQRKRSEELKLQYARELETMRGLRKKSIGDRVASGLRLENDDSSSARPTSR